METRPIPSYSTSDCFYIIGIDPQPKLLAYCLIFFRQTEKDSYHRVGNQLVNFEIVEWNNLYLRKKERFKTAFDWQLYILNECHLFSTKLIKKINTHFEGVHYWTPADKLRGYNVLFAVEQQRGRVNSIIEQSLLAAMSFEDHSKSFYFNNKSLYSLHPTTWKKAVKFQNQGTNKKNKDFSVTEISPCLTEYRSRVNISTKPGERIHDLCDAFLIAKGTLLKYVF